MVKRVLVPIDESPQSTEALRFALSEHADAEITAIHVVNPSDGTWMAEGGAWVFEELLEEGEQRAQEVLAKAERLADEAGVSVTTATERGMPARTIVEYAREHDIDQIVMGSHSRGGLTRILLGSVAELVVRRSPVTVTVVR